MLNRLKAVLTDLTHDRLVMGRSQQEAGLLPDTINFGIDIAVDPSVMLIALAGGKLNKLIIKFIKIRYILILI